MNTLNTIHRGIKALGSLGIGELIKNAAEHLPLGLIGGPIASVVAQIFTLFGSEITSHLSADVMARLGKNPKSLNHHLQRLFSQVVQHAVRSGIEVSYEAETGIRLDKTCRNKLKGLAKEFDMAFDVNVKTLSSSELISFLSDRAGLEEFRKLFEERVGHEHNPVLLFGTNEFPAGFATYFEKNLLPIIRILFIEELKTREFEKARIAYEQMMAEETYKSLQDIKKDVATLKTTNGIAPAKYANLPAKKFNDILEHIQSPQELEPVFASNLDHYLKNFDQKLNDILTIGKDTNTRVARIDIKTDRIEKGIKKGLILSYFLVIVAIGGIAIAYVYFQKKTFNATIELRDSKNNSPSHGSVTIEYGIKKEKATVNTEGIAMFTQIPSHFEKDSVEILLTDELNKNYALAPGFEKILLKPDQIIHVRLIEKIPDNNISLKFLESTSDKKKQEALVVKKETVHLPVTTSAVQSISRLGSALNGAIFTQSTSEDHLNFSALGTNTLAFHGKAGMYPVSGKVKISGNNLLVIEGNVTGSLILSANSRQLTGMLEINSSKAQRPIDLVKEE